MLAPKRTRHDLIRRKQNAPPKGGAFYKREFKIALARLSATEEARELSTHCPRQ